MLYTQVMIPGSTRIVTIPHGLETAVVPLAPWESYRRHDVVEFCFHSHGPVAYDIGGRREIVAEDETVMFWGELPHRIIRAPEGSYHYWISVPLRLFIRWGLNGDFIQRIINGELLREVAPGQRLLDTITISTWAERKLMGNESLLRSFSLLVQSRALLFAERYNQGMTPSGRATSHTGGRDSFHQLFDYITEHATKDFSIQKAAREAAINPTYASTLFREKSGLTIIAFVNMIRLYEAKRLLLTTDMKIIDIAMEAGFDSVSYFYRLFRDQTGESPSRFRKGHTIATFDTEAR